MNTGLRWVKKNFEEMRESLEPVPRLTWLTGFGELDVVDLYMWLADVLGTSGS